MRLRLGALCSVAVVASSLVAVAAETAAEPAQDAEVLRFMERALPFYPGSSLRIVRDQQEHTPSGAYRMVWLQRDCDSEYLSGMQRLVIDQATRTAWVGNVGQLPIDDMGVDLKQLRTFLDGHLPEVLSRVMRRKVELEWDGGDLRPGALIPFQLRVHTGYGTYLEPTAITADGRYFLLGSSLPFDRDPVEHRRQVLRASEAVVWDHASDSAKVEIVEFSDFECPGCRSKWPLIKSVLEAQGDAVQHGFVPFPLTTIHPWAFRAASAGWCVAELDESLLIPLKELYYSLQREMDHSEVKPTALDFAVAHDLDEQQLEECFLSEPSLNAIHQCLALGQRMAVSATPTYFVNGWMIQIPREEWFPAMVERLIAGQDP